MKTTSTFVLAFIVCLTGCRKKFDEPEYWPLSSSMLVDIKTIKNRVPLTGTFYRFPAGDTSLVCTVTADESSGNFLKQVFVCDEQGGAIQVKLLESGGLYTGDRIRIRLAGVYAVSANNMISLDSVNTETGIVKLSSGNSVSPKSCNISQITGVGSPLHPASMQSQLIELNGVEFEPAHRNKKFADAVGKSAYEYNLQDCSGNRISLRTSGWANFASKLTPAGKGRMIAVVSQYNNELQLVMRNYNEIAMQAQPCSQAAGNPVVTATFSIAAPVSRIDEKFDSISSGADFTKKGWINFAEKGALLWKGNVRSGTYKTIKASAYGSGESNIIWLLAPPVKYKTGLKLSFKTAAEYFSKGHPEPVMAYVSTNFNGLNFSSANWTKISDALYASQADGNYTGASGFKHSGILPLDSIPLLTGHQGNIFIAFRYAGTPDYTTNIYLDDLLLE